MNMPCCQRFFSFVTFFEDGCDVKTPHEGEVLTDDDNRLLHGWFIREDDYILGPVYFCPFCGKVLLKGE